MVTKVAENPVDRTQEEYDDNLSPAEKTRVIGVLRAQVAMFSDQLERVDHGERIVTPAEFARLCNLFHAAYCEHDVPETLDDLESFTGDVDRHLANLALEILGISL